MAYTIKAGDTLQNIASANKTTVADLMKANPNITDANKIQAGANLNLSQPMGVTAKTPNSSSVPTPSLPTNQKAPFLGKLGSLLGSADLNNIKNNNPITPIANNIKTDAANFSDKNTVNGKLGILTGMAALPRNQVKPTSTTTPVSATIPTVSNSTTSSTNTPGLPNTGSEVDWTGAGTSSNTNNTTNTLNRTYAPFVPTATAPVVGTTAPTETTSQKLTREAEEQAMRAANAKNNLTNSLVGIETTPGIQKSAVLGQQDILNRIYGGAVTAEAEKASALASLAGQAKPVEQFGQLTDPYTGKVIGAGATGNNPMLDNAVTLATNMIQFNNTDPNDPQIQSMMAPFGQAGAIALNSKISELQNGGYNTTAQSASAKAGTGFGVDAKTAALHLNQGLQQLDAIATPAISFFSKALINPTDSSVFNGTIREYTDKFGNTGAAVQANAIIADIKKYQGQIIAANNAGTPTGVTDTLASIDPMYLSAREITDYLNTLKTLGHLQLNTLQQNAGENLGTSTGNVGNTTSQNTNIPVSALNAPTTTNQIGQVAKGGFMGMLPGLAQGGKAAVGFSIAKQVLPKILPFIFGL